MGYDLHITRAESWAENEGHEITQEEWLKIVHDDPELTLKDSRQDFALWSGRSKYPDPWLAWRRGNIYSKNPDKAIVAKMISIAKQLNAKVQGDDEEIYKDASAVPD